MDQHGRQLKGVHPEHQDRVPPFRGRLFEALQDKLNASRLSNTNTTLPVKSCSMQLEGDAVLMTRWSAQEQLQSTLPESLHRKLAFFIFYECNAI